MCQSHLCKLKYYISNMGTESFAFIKQKRLTISYVISTFWTSKTCNLCISILCVVDIFIYIMAAAYLCTIYTIVFVCTQLCGICLHTIVWYLYVSMISDFWGLGTFKDGWRLLFQDAGLAKQVFSTLTGNNVSLAKDLKIEMTTSHILGSMIFLKLKLDPIFRRFSGRDEATSFPVAGPEVNCYCPIVIDSTFFSARWQLYQVRGTMRWAARSWKSRTLSTSAGSTNTPMERLVD